MLGWSPKFALVPGLLILLAAGPSPTGAIRVDYPEDGSIFPPEITPPTFLWHDAVKAVALWHIDISPGAGPPTLHATSRGERPRLGPIDPECVAATNQPPQLSPDLADSHSWTPDAATWQAIKRQSVNRPATVSFAGVRADGQIVSRGQVTIRTSADPVGAPIFYRDVPLMPSELEKGVIKPLSLEAIPLVAWRLRNLAEARSRVVMDNLPVCGNCHSFSADGKTLGMDLDGLQNNRGLYTLAQVAPSTAIRQQDLIEWSSPRGKLKGKVRVGFMSQVSPDGQYVATTVSPASLAGGPQEPPSNYYVANFKDYRFLQVFYPTRGILTWYSRQTGVLQPLPGADDPNFVQMGGVWSPEGQYLVFARAEATDPDPPGAPLAEFAGDPKELAMQYDLYRVPFQQGRGGMSEAIAGASRNGMSNTFPKVSPDGRWIVYVQSRNGELMRPDSQLYIVPAAGGEARRMRCNTARMNSWHSFSPNGRWMVFSSKARSPYTQLYLTHIDAAGNDSPAILIDNSTAANRAANIPEFVNIPPDGLRQIGGPVIDSYRLVNSATYLQRNGRYQESAAKWREVLAADPDNELAHRSLGNMLLITGHRAESALHLRLASEIKLRAAIAADPASAQAVNDLGELLLRTDRPEEAVRQFEKAVTLRPDSATSRTNLGEALARTGKPEEALAQLRQALALDAAYAPAHYQLGLVLSQRGDTASAIAEWRRAIELDPKLAETHASLGAALQSQGQSAEALAEWRAALSLQPNDAATLRRAAWLLATSPDAALRKGDEAMSYAIRAIELTGGKDAQVLDTLAAAYAENRQFLDAARTARRALETASPELAPAIRRRITLYESEQPFRSAN
jgi:tetratricopeptide (TPR) repeat protein